MIGYFGSFFLSNNVDLKSITSDVKEENSLQVPIADVTMSTEEKLSSDIPVNAIYEDDIVKKEIDIEISLLDKEIPLLQETSTEQVETKGALIVYENKEQNKLTFHVNVQEILQVKLRPVKPTLQQFKMQVCGVMGFSPQAASNLRLRSVSAKVKAPIDTHNKSTARGARMISISVEELKAIVRYVHLVQTVIKKKSTLSEIDLNISQLLQLILLDTQKRQCH